MDAIFELSLFGSDGSPSLIREKLEDLEQLYNAYCGLRSSYFSCLIHIFDGSLYLIWVLIQSPEGRELGKLLKVMGR